jgi:putative ABC transport system permease protein
MRVAAKINRLLGNLMRRHRLETNLDAELRAYLDEMAERKMREGVPLVEARRLAQLEADGLEQVKEDVRGTWLGNGIETTIRDVRYGVRALLRSPGFTVVVMLTLALGIGASVTMFSVMRAVLWRPLPYPAPQRIVMLQVDARSVANAGAAPGELFDLRARSRLLEDLSMISVVDANLDFGGEMEHLTAASVSNDFLPLLGGRPALGRFLNSQIDEGKDQVLSVLISDALWRRRLGADPAIVGRGVRINNLEVQIAGVLRPDFRLFLPPSLNASEQIDIWFPTGIGTTRQYRGFPIAARLRRGTTLAQANAELESLAAQFVREHADIYPDAKLRFTAHQLQDEMSREARPALFLLAGAVGFVLLIACVNVANLMLARGAGRQRELAIRRALGAGRSRVIRQLLAESLILALASGGAGLVVARFSLEAIAKLNYAHLPMQSRIAVDGSVTLFALALSIGASLVFGLLPAWRLSSGGVSDPLRAGRSETAAPGMRVLQRSLVVAEIALSIVPLVGGGLMLRSFLNLVRAPLGFDPTGVLTAKVPMNFRMYPAAEERCALYREILERIRALPGVESVGAASPLPLAPAQTTRRVRRADRPEVPGILATQQTSIGGYLHVMAATLRQGRDFTFEDIAAKRPVAIVDERLARRLWPEGAIGRRLVIETDSTREELEVVGVVAPVRATRVRDEDIPHFIIPYHLYPIEMSLVIKTRETAAALGPAINSAVSASHTGRAAFEIRPMGDYVTDSTGDTRFTMFVLAIFAGASVLLASVGLYGTLAYLVAQRTREFGIRLALGSSVSAIIAMVVREGAVLAAAGAVLGLAGASAMTGAIRQLLYDVRPFDGVTLAGVIALVVFVSVAAAGVPAWRATLIDPLVSLRSE